LGRCKDNVMIVKIKVFRLYGANDDGIILLDQIKEYKKVAKKVPSDEISSVKSWEFKRDEYGFVDLGRYINDLIPGKSYRITKNIMNSTKFIMDSPYTFTEVEYDESNLLSGDYMKDVDGDWKKDDFFYFGQRQFLGKFPDRTELTTETIRTKKDQPPGFFIWENKGKWNY